MRMLLLALALATALSGAALAQTAPAGQTSQPPPVAGTAGTVGAPPQGADSNAAVATDSNHEAAAPAHGRNSFTRGQATARLKRHGYADVAALKKDSDGVWRGTATKDGVPVQVWLDYKGNVGQQ